MPVFIIRLLQAVYVNENDSPSISFILQGRCDIPDKSISVHGSGQPVHKAELAQPFRHPLAQQKRLEKVGQNVQDRRYIFQIPHRRIIHAEKADNRIIFDQRHRNQRPDILRLKPPVFQGIRFL